MLGEVSFYINLGLFVNLFISLYRYYISSFTDSSGEYDCEYYNYNFDCEEDAKAITIVASAYLILHLLSSYLYSSIREKLILALK
jgi:hypothetical protein